MKSTAIARIETAQASTDREQVPMGTKQSIATPEEFAAEFKKYERKSAEAALELGRIVYEAKSTLKQMLFRRFCQQIGLKPSSSTIRKYEAIGRAYPRLREHAERLPSAWTTIYMITRIPEDQFSQMLDANKRFDNVTAKELRTLIPPESNPHALHGARPPVPIGTLSFFEPQGAEALHKFQEAWDKLKSTMDHARIPVRLKLDKKFEADCRRSGYVPKHTPDNPWHSRGLPTPIEELLGEDFKPRGRTAKRDAVAKLELADAD